MFTGTKTVDRNFTGTKNTNGNFIGTKKCDFILQGLKLKF